MSARQQMAHMSAAPPEDTLRGELATIAGWSQTLGLADDVRAGVLYGAGAAAGSGAGGCTRAVAGVAAGVATATAVGATVP